MAADTFTPSLQITLQGTGNNSNTWGVIADQQYSNLEAAITGDNGYAGGAGGINIAGTTTYSLTHTNGSPNQSRQLLYPFVGALSGNCTVTLPGVLKVGWAVNATSGGKTVILTTGGGTTLPLPNVGAWVFFYCDGTNITAPPVQFGNNGSGGFFSGQYGSVALDYDVASGHGGNLIVQQTATANWFAGSYGTFTATQAGSVLLETPNTAPFFRAAQTCYIIGTSSQSSISFNATLSTTTPIGATVTCICNRNSGTLIAPPNGSSNINGGTAGSPFLVPAASGVVPSVQRFFRLNANNWFTC